MYAGISAGTISAKEYTAVTSAGSWLQSLTNILSGVILQIYVKADNSASMFDFKVKDAKDREVYIKKNITGLLNELEKYIPMTQSLGPYRLQIINSDPLIETYDVLVMVQEIR